MTYKPPITRRGFLASAASTAVALTTLSSNAQESAKRQRVMRVAHLTDVHVQPERKADQGMVACLHYLQNQNPKPDVILLGGDCVMDSFAAKRDRTQLQWDLWSKILKNECSIPFKACLGNHDIWGWNQKKSDATGNEPDYGKKWAMEKLGMMQRYHHTSQAGWHFIALDSVQSRCRTWKLLGISR